MAAEKQFVDAQQSLALIENHALGRGQYLTYGHLAELLGYEAVKYARHVGQVCSLIDAACFWTRLPMLSLEKVRKENGDRNPESFQNEFEYIKQTLVENAEARTWTSEDLHRVTRTLYQHMNREAATLQWRRIAGFGQDGLGRMSRFI